MQASGIILDGGSKAINSQGINPSQLLVVIDSSDQFIGVQIPLRHHLISPQIQESKAIMLMVLDLKRVSDDKILKIVVARAAVKYGVHFPISLAV